jgi:G3E family GTPase
MPMTEHPHDARLPVTILTGFLGSGKTTLLNYILANQQGLKTAVIVNEIGDIAIDSELIVAADNGMVELSNGCICCSLNNDLVDAIFRVLERREPIDHLIVETTGLADPLPIILTFLRSEFRDRIRIDATITVADAENLGAALSDSETAHNQLRWADVILLNKCDLVDEQSLHAVELELGRIQQGARIIRTTRSQVALPLILSVGLFQSDRFYRDEPAHDHLAEDGFSCVSFTSDRPLAVDKFQYFLEQELPPEVFRGKGILWLHDSDKRFLFHLIGRRFSLDLSRWDGPRRNKLVLIGRNLDGAHLDERLQACLEAER